MKSSDLQRLEHMKIYCEAIGKTIERFGRGADILENDQDYSDSVSMKLSQIGELSVGLSDGFKLETKDLVQWKLIRGLRNITVHDYQSVNYSDIWRTITQDIPQLLKFCNEIIGQNQTL